MAVAQSELVSDSIDLQAHCFLAACCRDGALDVFDSTPDGSEAESLARFKAAADILVSRRLAQHVDEGRTRIAPTNAGRYWAANGGYMGFLKEEPPGGRAGGRTRNPELEALRFTYMKLRLGTFWWSFGLSLSGFVISLMSIGIALLYGDMLLR